MKLAIRTSVVIIFMLSFITSCSHHSNYYNGRNGCIATVAIGGEVVSKKESLAEMVYVKKIKLEKGRQLGAKMFVLFAAGLPVVPANIRDYPYVTCAYEGRKNTYGINILGFQIDFWDNNINHIRPPYLAQILFKDEYFYYYEAAPETSELQLVYKESYQQAVKVLREEDLKDLQKIFRDKLQR